jgi:uncharacterized OB-fold protein
MTELQIQQCKTCGAGWFPDRLRCPSCGGGEFDRISAGPGTVQEVTTSHRDNAKLGSVRLDAGPIVIALLKPPTAPDARIRLETTPRNEIWGVTERRRT